MVQKKEGKFKNLYIPERALRAHNMPVPSMIATKAFIKNVCGGEKHVEQVPEELCDYAMVTECGEIWFRTDINGYTKDDILVGSLDWHSDKGLALLQKKWIRWK